MRSCHVAVLHRRSSCVPASARGVGRLVSAAKRVYCSGIPLEYNAASRPARCVRPNSYAPFSAVCGRPPWRGPSAPWDGFRMGCLWWRGGSAAPPDAEPTSHGALACGLLQLWRRSACGSPPRGARAARRRRDSVRAVVQDMDKVPQAGLLLSVPACTSLIQELPPLLRPCDIGIYRPISPV